MLDADTLQQRLVEDSEPSGDLRQVGPTVKADVAVDVGDRAPPPVSSPNSQSLEFVEESEQEVSLDLALTEQEKQRLALAKVQGSRLLSLESSEGSGKDAASSAAAGGMQSCCESWLRFP